MPDLDIADLVADALAEAASVLESSREAGEEYVPALFVQRGEERVALCMAIPSTREKVMALCQLAAIGFQPTHIVLVTDTWQTPRGVNPVTGQDWHHGEMADLAMNHDGIAKGWVSEALSAVVVDNTGEHMVWELPYKATGPKVEWSPPELLEGVTGDLPAALVAMMTSIPEPPPPDVKVLDTYGMEGILAGRDCATARHIIGAGDIAALAFVPDSNRGRIIKALFPDGEATYV